LDLPYILIFTDDFKKMDELAWKKYVNHNPDVAKFKDFAQYREKRGRLMWHHVADARLVTSKKVTCTFQLVKASTHNPEKGSPLSPFRLSLAHPSSPFHSSLPPLPLLYVPIHPPIYHSVKLLR
jgi:hypothetical protein